MADLDQIAAVVGSTPEDPFVVFMGRADDVIRKASGLGVFDFEDADWAGLWGEDPDCPDQSIIETLGTVSAAFCARAGITGLCDGGEA